MIYWMCLTICYFLLLLLRSHSAFVRILCAHDCVCVGRWVLFLYMVKDSNEQIPRYNAVKYVIKLFAERKSLLYRMDSMFADP